jgi:hypothetical protein
MAFGETPRSTMRGGSGECPSSSHHKRKSANEEFFLMALLSYKLNHQEIENILAVRLYYLLIAFRLMAKLSIRKWFRMRYPSMSGRGG